MVKVSSCLPNYVKYGWAHAKSLQENRLLKTETLEQNKHFKSHQFKVGQLIEVKNHLRNMFDTRVHFRL